MIRVILVALGFLGAGLLALAIFGWLIVSFVKVVRVLPVDQSTTSAWIGFAGSVVGALITVVVAVFALWPAYRQMDEMQRSSAVQAGQILRNRWRAAQAEIEILMKGASVQRASKLLVLTPKDIDREHWIANHPNEFNEIKDKIIPQAESTQIDIFNALSGVDLPDLDRSAFSAALQQSVYNLNGVLDGKKRNPNGGAILGEMNGKEWRDHVEMSREYFEKEWPKAQITYNNKINAALQILRFQILASDRAAVGRENYKQFDDMQKFVDNPPS